MLILGIDTSGAKAGASLLEDDVVLATRSALGAHSATLLPMINELLRSQERSPGELALIGVARGPGAYTGLRVGVVTAKTLGRATGAAVLGVPTLDAMASQAPRGARRVLVALKAYKGKLLYAWFERNREGRLVARGSPALMPATTGPRAGSGEAVITDAPDLLPDLDDWGAVVPAIEESSLAVATIARSLFATGSPDETYSIVPEYLRPPSITVKSDKQPPSERKGT